MEEIFLVNHEHTRNLSLLEQTAAQLIKDFRFVNVTITFSGDPTSAYEELSSQIVPSVDQLIRENIQQFYQLLYHIDISEEQIKRAVSKAPEKSFIQVITELILKRELQKVVIRNTYSNKGKLE